MHNAFPGLALAGLLGSFPVHPTPALDRAGSAAPRDPQPAPARTLAGPIYSCVVGGVQVLADRPCAVGSMEARYVALRTPPAPGEPPSTAARIAPPARTLPATQRVPDRSSVDDSTCQRLQQRLDALDDRMRQGYRARDAGRLWEQRRGLKQDLRSAGC